MTTPIADPRSNTGLSSSLSGYKSMMLELFVDTLGRYKDAHIIDVGPVCEENILFFARRMKKFFVCDMFMRLNREARKPHRPERVWNHLDYPAENFHGILLWDFCDHLEDDGMNRLAQLCFEMLKPEGLLLLIAFEKQPSPPLINTFVTRDGYRIDFRVQHHLDLPWHCRHNRALMSLMGSFHFIKSFRYHNGLREFLFKKPGVFVG